jgi:hypothetical protein
MVVQGNLRAGITRPSSFICPDPCYAAMRETTERVNKFIPVAEAGGRGQVPGEGKGGG